MNFLIKALEELKTELLIGVDNPNDFKMTPQIIVGRALGRTFCTDIKVVVLLSFQGFLSSLSQLALVGNLSRKNYYLLVVYSANDELASHLKPRSIMFGMGFTVFKYTASYTPDDIVRSLSDIIPKINGPVCVFIEESSLNG